MELVIALFLVAALILFFKLMAVIFKAGFFVLSIPLQIIAAVVAVVAVVALLPFAVIAGVFTVLLAPLFVLGPFLPFLLIILGLYLIAKN